MKLLITFIILNIINIISQVTRNLTTVKCGKFVAALASAVSYGMNSIIIVYTVCDLPLAVKVAVVMSTTFIGVLFVKWLEEKLDKDRLWKIEATFTPSYDGEAYDIKTAFAGWGIPCNYIEIGRYVIVNCYCHSKEEARRAKQVIADLGGKMFFSEGKRALH